MQHNGSRIREDNTNAEYRSFPVYDGGAGFIVLSHRDPHVLREDSEDCEATTSKRVVDGVSQANSVVMYLPITGLWCCLTMRRHVDSAASSPMRLGWKRTAGER